MSRAQSTGAPQILDRISDYVERYYARAQSLVALETITLQPLNRDLSFDGFARRLEYEVRLEWDPSSSADRPAQVARQLLRVNGRPPREGDEPRCLDPRSLSPEPLAMLLPAAREKYVFSSAGLGSVGRRPAVMIDYRPLRPEAPKVEWDKECGVIDLPGRTRGRVWADPLTAEILRFDEHVTGQVDIAVPRALQKGGGPSLMTIERADVSIRYLPVTFRDPDETLILPATIESVVVIRNSGTPQRRITQVLSNYRRFVTDTRIVR